MTDKIINNIVIDNQPGKFYAPNVLTGLEDTEELSELKSGLSNLGLSVVDGAINITYEEVTA